VLAASMPPGGISMAKAVATADAYLVSNPSSSSDSWTLLRAQAGPRFVLGATGGEPGSEWVWAIWYVSSDGYFETTVYVGYLDGLANQSSGGNVTSP
jgi:hypothetical protein